MGLLMCLYGRVVSPNESAVRRRSVTKVRMNGRDLKAALGTAAPIWALRSPRSFQVSRAGNWDRHSTLSLPF